MSPGSRAEPEPGRGGGVRVIDDGNTEETGEERGERGGEVECRVRTILQILSLDSGPGWVKTSQECGEVERAPAQSQSPPVPLNRQWSSQLPFPPEH